MEVLKVFHMNKGNDETSYAKNSTLQSNIISVVKSIADEALRKLISNTDAESIGIADLGCSSGPNNFLTISNIIGTINATCRESNRPFPELRIDLNDLPGNDYNYIFTRLPEFQDKLTKDMEYSGAELCFVSAVAGSFYGRLFPSRSLHFVHSSSSLHWLSQIPTGLESKNGEVDLMNEGKIYISKTSPQSVIEAYASQYRKDMLVFLGSRSKEMVTGGRMVLSFVGRNSSDPTTDDAVLQCELTAQALMDLAKEGLIEKEKIDTFNAPTYMPCTEELVMAIQEETSFEIEGLETITIDWESHDGEKIRDPNSKSEALLSGQRIAKIHRAATESLFQSHFGKHVMDRLFQRYEEIVGDYIYEKRASYTNIVVSLVRKP